MTETPQPVQQTPPPVTTPGGPQRPTRWHIPIGVIAIILAGLGMIGLVTALSGAGAMNPKQQELMGNFPEWYQSYTRAGSFAGAGIAVLLLGGGILLLKRRPACRPLLLAYAVLAMISNLIGAVFTFKALGGMTGEGPEAEIMRVSMLVGGVVGTVVGMVFPVFLIVWFLRSKIRLDIQSWDG